MVRRGVAALITDGAIRDVEGVRRTGLPVWCSGVSAPPSVAHLTFVDWQQPIGCGGVAIFPDDILIADQDGAVVIPKDMARDILDSSGETEVLEEWILEQVNAAKAARPLSSERNGEGGIPVPEIRPLVAATVRRAFLPAPSPRWPAPVRRQRL